METQKPLTFAEKVAASSQVRHVSYDADNRQLHVVFKRTPALYIYDEFLPEAWAKLQAADSVGSFLLKNVTRPINGVPPYVFTKAPLPDHLKEDAPAQ